MPTLVTDPALLAQLNGGKSPVTDPALLAQLNGTEPWADPTDIAKSGGIGLAKGVIGLAGTPGLAADYLARGSKIAGDYLGEKLGFGPSPQVGEPVAMTPESIQKGTERYTGEFYKPQTRPGRYAETVGEMLPASLLGPGGTVAKLGTGVAAGLGSEGAGQLTEGTEAEPYARVAGAVAGGLAPLRMGRAASPAVPTVAELKAASRAGYNSPEVAAVEIHPQPVANLSAQIENDLASRGFRDRANQGKPVFEEIRDMVPPTQALNPNMRINPVRVADLHSARKALGEIAKEVDAVGKPTSNATAATIAKQHLDDFLPNIQQRDVLAGDAGRAASIMREADANWGAAKRAEQVDLQLTRADRQAAKSGMGGNVENAMRQRISALLDNPKRTVGFSDAEKQAMEDIVRGTRTRNALRIVGKAGVDGGLSAQLAAAAAYGSGGASIPVTVAATIARYLGQNATARAGNSLSEMVRSRSPVGQGNIGTHAVQRALNPPNARAMPYSAIAAALMQPQGTR